MRSNTLQQYMEKSNKNETNKKKKEKEKRKKKKEWFCMTNTNNVILYVLNIKKMKKKNEVKY